ncbi:hypothetical protein OQX61_22355 [Pedobacter sp. PLR]|uniref:hypothetical protein n=1 Tax=Pedobacter sp. PLR TaxID=2994465 RepID=UPI0022452505|nr:hypothetical protein [Pedobacter sp. PLR]MCX2454028.1 hypothetical protein [Pedobacter sp. PLR]
MKKYIIGVFLLVYNGYVYAQGAAGVGKLTVNTSAVLDLSNSTKKAFLPARVLLTDLFSNVTPISTPAEGLIVYNTSTVQPKGFYIWNKGSWSLMAAKENSVTNAVIQNTAIASGINLPVSGTFVPITGGAQLFSNIPAFTSSGGNFTLPPGNYTVQVALNIQALSEVAANGIGATVRTNIHYYAAKLSNGASSYGQVMTDNQTSNSSSTTNSKQHVANFSFSFQITSSATMSFNLARVTGGTYEGNIDILNSFIHIQRSML